MTMSYFINGVMMKRLDIISVGTHRFTSTLNEKKWLEEKIFDKNNVNCAIYIKETNEFIGCIF
jgi:hypothetical protein